MASRNSVDRISALPDDILLSVVSLLQLRDVVTTSVLSRRWRYLWAYTNGVFDLDYPSDMSNKSIERFNHVLDMHRGCTIDELRVSINKVGKKPYLMKKLIKFALDKRVKTLELDLCYRRVWGNYELKLSTLRNYSGSLSSIRLEYVNVADDVLEWILRNSPQLTGLRVRQSSTLIDFKYASPLPNLKHLEIIECPNLCSIDLHVKNLVSYTYRGHKTVLHLKEVPYRARANFNYSFFTIDITGSSSYVYSRLKSLVLDMAKFSIKKFDNSNIPKLPMLENLENWNVRPWQYHHNCYLRWCTLLLKASPKLLRFVLKIKEPLEIINLFKYDGIKMEEIEVKYQHNRVNVVEVTGYRSKLPNYAKLVLELLEKFPCVEQVKIVEPLAYKLPQTKIYGVKELGNLFASMAGVCGIT